MSYFKKLMKAFSGLKDEMSLDKNETQSNNQNVDLSSNEKIYNIILKKIEQVFKQSIHELYTGKLNDKKISFDTIFIIKVKQDDFDDVCYSNVFIKSTAIQMFYNELIPYRDKAYSIQNYSDFWSFTIVPQDQENSTGERVIIESCQKDLLKQAQENNGIVTTIDIHGNRSSINLAGLNLDLDILADPEDSKTYWVTDFNSNLEVINKNKSSRSQIPNSSKLGVLGNLSYISQSGNLNEIKLYKGITSFGSGRSDSNDYVTLEIQGLMTNHFKINLTENTCLIASKFPMIVDGKQIPISTFSNDNWLELNSNSTSLNIGTTVINLTIK